MVERYRDLMLLTNVLKLEVDQVNKWLERVKHEGQDPNATSEKTTAAAEFAAWAAGILRNLVPRAESYRAERDSLRSKLPRKDHSAAEQDMRREFERLKLHIKAPVEAVLQAAVQG